MASIPSADAAIPGLVMFVFVALHLFSMGGSHSSAVSELLHLIDRLEEIHTKFQVMVTDPHLATTFLYDMLCQSRLYLNSCVSVLVSVSEALEATGVTVPFTLDPILLKLEGGRYSGLIISGALADILTGRWTDDTRGGGVGAL